MQIHMQRGFILGEPYSSVIHGTAPQVGLANKKSTQNVHEALQFMSSVKLPWLGPPQARTTVVFFSQPPHLTSVCSSHVLIGVTLTLKSRIRATGSCGIFLSGCRAPSRSPQGPYLSTPPPSKTQELLFPALVPTHPALWLPDSSQLFKIQRDAVKPFGSNIGLAYAFLSFLFYFATLATLKTCLHP